MLTTMMIMNKGFLFDEKNANENQGLAIINPDVIPRIGEKIDMGFSPAHKVIEVLHRFCKTGKAEHTIFVIVE